MAFEDHDREEVYCEFQHECDTMKEACAMDLDQDSMDGTVRPDQVFSTGTWPEADDDDFDMMAEGHWLDEDDENALLEQLIEVSIRKIHQLQSFHRKDERRRVLIVNMLHSLLMKKIALLREEGGLVGEDSSLLNNLLQEKICGLGLGRSVRIWVDAPKKPGQMPTLQLPVKGMMRKAKGARKAEDADGEIKNENTLAPSARDTASY
jgi:hypothetical protein